MTTRTSRRRRLDDAYRFPGFRPLSTVRGAFGECGTAHRAWYDRKTRRVRDLSCGDTRVVLEVEVRRVQCKKCGGVKSERLSFLVHRRLYTKRFAHHVGQRCKEASIVSVAQEFQLDWHRVKELEKDDMREVLAKTGLPAPEAIGIDEISIRKGHTYRIVVSDLPRGRPIWFGGEDRSEASMQQFYDEIGPKKAQKIRLAVMDMWLFASALVLRRVVETVSQGHAGTRAAGGDPVRQVSYRAASERCARRRAPIRICARAG